MGDVSTVGASLELAQKRAAAQPSAARDPIKPLSDEELEAPLPLPAGLPSLERYQLAGELGRGGQGVVYDARQLATGRQVAVKILCAGPFAGADATRRFDREASILAALDHPNIVSIIDRGITAEGFAYIVMPFVRGCPLDQYLYSANSSATVVVRLFIKIIAAMAAARSQGVVHRDLKPANILVDGNAEPHILDFGLATCSVNVSMTRTGQILGSLPYASPEQVRGDNNVDARADLYALGLLLYQGLARRPAYRIEGPTYQLLDNILRVQPPPPSFSATATTGISRQLDHLVLRCLHKLPEKRFSSANELREELLIAAEGRPRTHLYGRIVRWHPWMTYAVLLSTGVFSTALAAWRLHDARNDVGTAPSVVSLRARTNSIGERFVLIPAGQNAGARLAQPTWFSVTEVTREQYAAVMGVPRLDRPAFPIADISWLDAHEFCRRLAQREGVPYRLPTVREWQYVWLCRKPCEFGAGSVALPVD